MASAKDVLAAMKKDYGDKAGGVGGSLPQVERVPTGCFELDYATGGGWPKGYTSIVYGFESSGKSNLALKSVASYQMLWPDKSCVWMAVEPFDADWAQEMGVDTDKLIVMKPDYAEQCVDMAEGFLGADDCGMVVVDSVAAMATDTSTKKSAEDAVMGGTGVVMSRFCDKVMRASREADKEDRQIPTLLLVNQIRTKVGIVFGSPLAMPGGAKQKFLSSLTVRVSGKNIMDNKVSKVMPVRKETQFVVEKWKVRVAAVNGRFEMAMLPHNGLQIGECEDWPTISGMLKSLGLLTKAEKGGGWLMYDETYPTLSAARERMTTDKVFSMGVRKALIEAAMENGLAPIAPEA
jgi:recombination protein RecA